jgi:transcriptional regulator with XRE-family HTH domain
MNIPLLVARKRAAITQEELAAKAGLSQADISRIEKGGWTPPREVQERLAAALNVPVADVFAPGEAA